MSEAWLKQKLVELHSLFIRMRDKYCVLCGSNYELQCGHFWHRDMAPTEFSEINCHALCSRCNNRHEYKPQEFTEWLLGKLGQVEFDRLSRLAHSSIKLDYGDLLDLYESRRAMVKEMKEELERQAA